MTRTITLTIATVGAALLFVVPAYGDNWGADQAQQQNQPTIASENTPESAALRAERLRSEGLNRKYQLGAFAVSPVTTYKDAHERVVEPQSLIAERLRSEGLNKRYGLGEFAPVMNYKDANERTDVLSAPNTPESVPVASSGREVEWPQIGIGFGIGIALAIALGLSLKATRPRTLAH